MVNLMNTQMFFLRIDNRSATLPENVSRVSNRSNSQVFSGCFVGSHGISMPTDFDLNLTNTKADLCLSPFYIHIPSC